MKQLWRTAVSHPGWHAGEAPGPGHWQPRVMLLKVGQVNVQQGEALTRYTAGLVGLLYAVQEVVGDALPPALQQLLLLSYEALCRGGIG